MHIYELYLKNFRNFEEATFTLHPGFTVIIGDNGLGKSSLLHALRIACGTYILGLERVPKRNIRPNEIRLKEIEGHFVAQLPVTIKVKKWAWLGQIQNSEFKREIAVGASKTGTSDADVGPARKMGQQISELINSEGRNDVDCPIIAFFGTARVNDSRQDRNNGDAILKRQIILHGYANWDSMQAGNYKYNQWLKGLNLAIEVDKRMSDLFLRTIKGAIPYIQNIRHSGGQLFLECNINGTIAQELSIENQSDGLQMLTEMVAELIYRCIILNGHLGENAIKASYGIVMMDQLDIHLHPNWQRHVVADLQKAFPKIQFIATTHSPFIVGSLKTGQLINLSNPGFEPEIEILGATLEDIGETEMKIENFQRSSGFIEMEEKAFEFYRDLKNGKSEADLTKLKERLDYLVATYSDNPAYTALLKAEYKSKLNEAN